MSPESRIVIRPPSVAGTFYPAQHERLRHDVDQFVAQASRPQRPRGRLRALVAPHAGYIYSGPIAGTAYALLAEVSAPPRHVAVLGPSHYVDFQGLALPAAGAFETPLGVVPVDILAAKLSRRFAQIIESERAHRREHSLEVQLPFLQRVLPVGFTVLPLAVGRATPAEVSEVIEFCWNQPDTLVVVSTDLSHYLPAIEAHAVDAATARQIVAGNFEDLLPDQACGHYPLAGLLLAARRRGFAIELLDLRNSADTAGDPERVVGYASFAVHEPRPSAEAADA